MISAKVDSSIYPNPEAAGRSIIEPGDAIVITPARSADCLSDSLLQVHPTLRIVLPDEFRRVVFADQPADDVTFAVPIPESQQKLLATQTFRDRIAPLRLRYLVSVGEHEYSRGVHTIGEAGFIPISCVKSLTMSASVLDLKDGREVGGIGIHAAGERGLVLYAFIPIFFFVETVRGPVYKELGERLGNYLAGRDPTPYPIWTPGK